MTQLPPTHSTLSNASHSGALASVMPPVGPLYGIAGSPGVVMATALVLEQGTGRIPRRSINKEESEHELERYADAVEEAKIQIAEVHTRVASNLPAEHLKILEAYQMMLADPTLAASVKHEIVDKGRNRTILVFKKRRRQNSKRSRGHRQDFTLVRITEILTDGKQPSKKADAEKKPAARKPRAAKAAVAAPAAVAE